MSGRMVEVAVSTPRRTTFTYLLPDSIVEAAPGQRVLVPFGRSRAVGFYLGPAQDRPRGLRRIGGLVDPTSLFTPQLVTFCRWLADYYLANPADCLDAALPTPLRGRKTLSWVWSEVPGWLPGRFDRVARPGRRLSAETIQRLHRSRGLWTRLVAEGALREELHDPAGFRQPRVLGYRAAETDRWAELFPRSKAAPAPFAGMRTRRELLAAGWTEYRLRKALQADVLLPVPADDFAPLLDYVEQRDDARSLAPNAEQNEVIENLVEGLGDGFQVSLLHGVTGSGKTLVYCHVCREVLRRGKTALVLTPEIALSGTTLAYFRGFFGDSVTVLHSAMTDRERLDSWQGLRQGRYRIAVGPRSAVFAPACNLGLIIVDEEHDASYKQDDPAPRFHGRDAAIMRAKIEKVPVLLGSASPSFESYQHAREGRYRLLRLSSRPSGVTLPSVHVVDMSREGYHGGQFFFSKTLTARIDEKLAARQQVILYLNRRGYAPMLKCRSCGFVPVCPECQVNLTYHKSAGRLTCHYCGYIEPVSRTCPSCRKGEMSYLGAGTQKVEEAVAELFPEARALRLDSDAADGRRRGHRILCDFGEGQADLLLGTQMVAKGLDFPGVTLVGVVSADLALDMPDFRASEKAFARLLQVAGRSGRARSPGDVIIQTYYPQLPLIDDVARQDYDSFFEREIISRRELGFPPFGRLVNATVSGRDEREVQEQMREFRARLRTRLAEASQPAEVLGPAPCPLYRLRGRYRRHLLMKTKKMLGLIRLLSAWEAAEPSYGLSSRVRVTIDVDPDNMM